MTAPFAVLEVIEAVWKVKILPANRFNTWLYCDSANFMRFLDSEKASNPCKCNFLSIFILFKFFLSFHVKMEPIPRMLTAYTQPTLRGRRSSPVISYSRLPNTTADKHPKCFLFQFPPSDPVVRDTWRRDRHSQVVESNLPELRVLFEQSRLQASHLRTWRAKRGSQYETSWVSLISLGQAPESKMSASSFFIQSCSSSSQKNVWLLH